MGCYDTVSHPCPLCGDWIEWQSKAGQCSMRDYTIYNVPADVAGDLNGMVGDCKNCEYAAIFKVQTIITIE